MGYITGKNGCIAWGAAGDDGEYKKVGAKNTPILNFSIAGGKDASGKTVWFKCQAWNPIASRFKDGIKKGETYFLCGEWESRDYQGKTYHTLSVKFISDMQKAPETAAIVSAVAEETEASFEEMPIGDEDDLPF